MNFREATDALFERVTHDDLAEALGVSVPSIRQARLDSKAMAFRQPPDGWERAVTALAEARALHFQKLARKLKG
jgi:hypothetical protein